jgi:hypothetical protein
MKKTQNRQETRKINHNLEKIKKDYNIIRIIKEKREGIEKKNSPKNDRWGIVTKKLKKRRLKEKKKILMIKPTQRRL